MKLFQKTQIKNIAIVPYLLIMLTAIGLLASDIYIISLPNIKMSFNLLSDSQAQLTITVFFLGTIIASIFSGYLSDLYGRRTICLNLLAIFISGSLLCYINYHLYPVFLMGRFLQGLGAGGISLVGYAIMQDCLHNEEAGKMIAWLGIILIFIPTISPLLGGFILTRSHWTVISIFILLLSSFSFLLALFYLPETHKGTRAIQERKLIKNMTELVNNKHYLLNVIIYPLASLGYWFILTDSSFIFTNHFNISVLSYKYIISMIVFMFAAGIFAFRILGKSNQISIKYGAFFCFIGALWLTTSNVIFFVIGCSLYNFGLGFIYAPSTASALSAVSSMKGLAATLRTVLIMSASAIGATAAQYIPLDISTFWLQLLFVSLSCSVFVLAFKAENKIRSEPIVIT